MLHRSFHRLDHPEKLYRHTFKKRRCVIRIDMMRTAHISEIWRPGNRHRRAIWNLLSLGRLYDYVSADHSGVPFGFADTEDGVLVLIRLGGEPEDDAI